MPDRIVDDFVEVPGPVAVLLEFAYFILLAFGSIASIGTICYFFSEFLDNMRSSSPAIISMETTSDEEAQEDEGPDEECVSMEFENDTDEEYMRRPY